MVILYPKDAYIQISTTMVPNKVKRTSDLVQIKNLGGLCLWLSHGPKVITRVFTRGRQQSWDEEERQEVEAREIRLCLLTLKL